LLIFGCEFLLGPDEPAGGGNLVISLGEGGRAAVPTTEEQAQLRYELALTGPREQKITVSLAPGQTFNKQVTLGEWHIYVEAYNPDDVLIGIGSATVRVRAGIQNEARVRMTIYVAVTGITDVPLIGTAETALPLSGTVEPSDATYKTIVWTVSSQGTTGAEITDGNKLTTTGAGTAVVTATVTNGTAIGTPYTQDFSIAITGIRMIRTINGVNIPFRYVPAGSFMLNQDESGNTPPDLTMTISNGYWMGETEVTQELFAAVMGTNPSQFRGPMNPPDSGEIQDQRPVEQINWYDAIAFCNKLSLADGKDPVYSVIVSGTEVSWATLAYNDIPNGSINADWDIATIVPGANGYRLPTEMEWMWAAMGADTSVQPNITGYSKAFAGNTGSNSINDYAWYGQTGGNSNGKTHEVGKKTANELGLYDMSGNVWEWCWDWDGSYPSGNQTDYKGPSSGTDRVDRGGGWSDSASSCTVVFRDSVGPPYYRHGTGIRVVCP
jgi:formylglycine-generating enzyme required for sulfatase activity